MTWFIEGASVPEKEYLRLLKSLKETGEGWYCKKTADGGRTGYEAKSRNGTVYVVESVTDSAGERQTINRKQGRR